MNFPNYNEVTITFADGTERDVLFVVRHPRSSWVFAPEVEECHNGEISEVTNENRTAEEIRDQLNEFVIFNEAANSIWRAQELTEVYDIKESLLSAESIVEIEAAHHTVSDGFGFAHTTDLTVPANEFTDILIDDEIDDISKTLKNGIGEKLKGIEREIGKRHR